MRNRTGRQHAFLGHQGANRRCRTNYSMEFSAANAVVETASRAGGGQLRRAETRRTNAVLRYFADGKNRRHFSARRGECNFTDSVPKPGKPLASSPKVDKVAFTGETTTGQLIMQYASKNLNPVTMELGGKSPNIFFSSVMAEDDAFLDKAVEGAVLFAFNQGEVCTCPSRLLVQEDIYDEFMARVRAADKRHCARRSLRHQHDGGGAGVQRPVRKNQILSAKSE